MDDEYMTPGEYMSAAIGEYARNHGELDTERAWILTPFDTWVKNPHYTGPAVPHPEEYDYDDYL